jgi:NADH/F420H2 dehydrogenase subunit C
LEAGLRTAQRIGEAIARINEDLPGKLLSGTRGLGDIIVVYVKPEDLVQTAMYLRDNPYLQFNFLSCISAVDLLDRMELVYHMHSISRSLSLRLKTTLGISNPVVDSVASVWPTANWHEREAYDLFGVGFVGHPDLRRILLEDEFEGYPMLKTFPQPQGHDKPQGHGK